MLHLDGFQLYSVREKQYTTGYTYSTIAFGDGEWSLCYH